MKGVVACFTTGQRESAQDKVGSKRWTSKLIFELVLDNLFLLE